MWKGARGNQVSPDPWGDDPVEVEEVPMEPPSYNDWDQPKQSYNKPVQQKKQESKIKNESKSNGEIKMENIPEKKVESEFVYRSKEKKQVENMEEVDTYINKRFNNSHAWTPYLCERKRELLMAGPVKPSKGLRHRVKNRWNSFKISWNEFLYSFEVWRNAIKKIEGHQGAGVASYFVFLRWLFILNIFIFLLIFWVITFFQVTFDPETTYDTDLTGTGSSAFTTTVAETCTTQYNPNVTSDALSLILGFFQGTGWMEETAMFNGYYVDRKVKLAASNYNLPLAYFLVTVAVMLISLIVMVRNTLSNFKETVLAQENAKQATYCNGVFAGFDYSVIELEAVELKQRSIYRGLVADLGEQRYEIECQNRTTGQKCRLYTVRIIVNFIIILMLAGAGAAIYYAQDYSTEFTTDPDVENKYHSLVILVVQFLPSIVIGLLNGIYPLIFDVLVIFEKYRPAFVIKISLIRMVFLKLASLAMVVASLYVQVTCNDQNACLIGQNSCPAIECWESYVGQAVYKLVVMDFLINVGVTLGVELPRKLITTKCECGLLQKVGPAIFDIPKNVLDLVYGQTLLWLGFYFAPLLSAVCIVTFFLVFYLKMLSAMYNTVPPEKPYQASKSNSFFTVILMIAFFLICVPVGYTLSNMDPSPMCGPFRIYNKPSDIIDVQINNAASWFQTVWNIVTSAAVVSSLLILLLLAIYYCSALNSAHKDLVENMKDQLVLEGKDKQYLLSRIAELTGEPPKKQPPPYQKPQLKTINETPPPPVVKGKSKPVKNSDFPEKNGDIGVEKTEEINLYGKEKSIILSPVNGVAPQPALYKNEKDVKPVTPAADFRENTWNNPSPDTSHFVNKSSPPPVVLPVNTRSSPPAKLVSTADNQPSPVNNTPSYRAPVLKSDPVKDSTPNNGHGSSPLFANNSSKKTAKEALDDW
ncbi:transmembrane channel-like protein 7 isoform X1 [Ruditapes philippinarum]|uniref:transmembrane channel-like protein 7 isoform X1 n=1 Tax=Ruditapes philippinarum TaxID=129788 RepID=UPI00295B1D97|nr:transmembrane channel-like protein 7 isoform X1 [Ruditapes philippinarum]